MPGTSDVTQLDSISGQQTLQKSTSGAAWVKIAGAIPVDSIPIYASSGNVAASVATASMPASAGRTNFLTGFEITSSGSTVAAVVNVTITGTIGGTLTYVYATVAGVTAINQPLIVQFTSPILSTINTAITVSLPSLGAGNTNAAVVVHGYQF